MKSKPIPWQPSASIEALKERAHMIAAIRQFFRKRQYLEVETPIMSQYGVTDTYLTNIKVKFRRSTYYLQTSPEYHMKRLLAAFRCPIFQLARVFRDDELGRWHNPEFTMLEWYQLGVDQHSLLNELDGLLQALLQTKPIIKMSYRQIFLDILQIDPHTVSIQEFKGILKAHHLDKVLAEEEKDRDQYLFLLMTHLIEPALAKEQAPIALYDFPASQASLAKIKDNVAQRFEVYYQGIELANGFHELTDAKVQAERFKLDQKKRKEQNLPKVQADPFLLAALAHGLPDCSGVALGFDRLLALSLKKTHISNILAFDFVRA